MRPAPDVPVAPPALPPADASDFSAAAGEVLRRFHALPAARLALLRRAAAIALECGRDLYWVGGGVRDLWLGTNELDIDLVVEGGLEPFAERLAAALGSELRSFPQFLTAEVQAPDGVRVDLAQVRCESYAAPAALPQVAPGTLASDFFRRDFTINCLAIPLAPAFGERLIDACGGVPDLVHRCLRILHPDSFRDDPTRILRGLEFAARFGFALAPETAAEAARAIAGGHLRELSPARLGEGLRRALGRAESAGRVLQRLHELRVLSAIEPGLERAGGAAARFDAALAVRRGGPLGATFRLALLCLALDLDGAERARLARRLALAAAERALVVDGPERVGAARAVVAGEPQPSIVHACLAGLTDEEMALVAAQTESGRAWVTREYDELRPLRLRIGGRDLIAAGEAPGPALGRALELTLAARQDGRIDPGEELAFALRAARGGAS